MAGMMGTAPSGATVEEANAWAIIRMIPDSAEYQKRLKVYVEARVSAEALEKSASERIRAAEARESEATAKIESDRREAERQAKAAQKTHAAALDRIKADVEDRCRLMLLEAEEKAQVIRKAAQDALDTAEKERAQTSAAWQAVKAREDDLKAAIEAAERAKADAEAQAADLRNRIMKINALAG